jgi:hypothetical protein
MDNLCFAVKLRLYSRFLGCTEDRPCCYLPHPENPPGGQPVLMCKWADKSQTLCINPACLAKAKEELAGQACLRPG